MWLQNNYLVGSVHFKEQRKVLFLQFLEQIVNSPTWACDGVGVARSITNTAPTHTYILPISPEFCVPLKSAVVKNSCSLRVKKTNKKKVEIEERCEGDRGTVR